MKFEISSTTAPNVAATKPLPKNVQLISTWTSKEIIDGKKVETCRNYYYKVNNSFMYCCENLLDDPSFSSEANDTPTQPREITQRRSPQSEGEKQRIVLDSIAKGISMRQIVLSNKGIGYKFIHETIASHGTK